MGIFYRELRPDAPLSGYVAYYWMLRFGNIQYPVKTTPPDGGADIVIDMDNPSDPVLFGQSAGYFAVPQTPGQNIFGVRLKPGTAHVLLSVSADEFFDSAIPLSLLLPARAFGEYRHALEKGRICSETGFAAAADAIGRWLSFLFDSCRCTDERTGNMLKAMELTDRDLSVDAVADALALSPRQVERLFGKVYGLTPKTFLRINRFQRVLTRRNKTDDDSWADISQTYGYFDQPHLHRDFREFAGATPLQYFNPEFG